MSFGKPPIKTKSAITKAEKTAAAQDVVAAFLAAGGRVKKMPAVAATIFACANCGHSGIAGVSAGKVRKCPRCRVILS